MFRGQGFQVKLFLLSVFKQPIKADILDIYLWIYLSLSSILIDWWSEKLNIKLPQPLTLGVGQLKAH